MSTTNDQLTEATELMDELRSMTSEEMRIALGLICGPQSFAETCIHEASHAVIAVLLDVPFEYVTVYPTVLESGGLRVGHIHWPDIWIATRDSYERYAVAAIAPQVVLPRFGIERTTEESEEEFSGDNTILDVLIRFKPDLSHCGLLLKAREMLTPAVLYDIHAVAEALKDRGTLTREDVRQIISGQLAYQIRR